MAGANHGDYVHGQMDMTQHEQTFRGFMAAAKWISLLSLVVTLFFTLWFAVGAGFWAALFPTIIFTAFGIWFVRFFFPPPHKGGH